MKRQICICVVLLLALSRGYSATRPPDVSKVRLEVTRASKSAGQLHWKIRNNSDVEIYVYNFFLLGPALNVEDLGKKEIFDTTPITIRATCPPDRFPPVLLTVIRSGGVIEGNFSDSRIRKAVGKQVSLKIAVGSEPYTVVVQAKAFAESECKHSPFDAIVQWGTMIESNAVSIP